MAVLLRRSVGVLLATCALGLGGCGAGLITGIASSGDGGSSPEVRVPALSLPSALLPLVPAAGDVRTVIVADAQLVGSAIEVRIARADGVSAVAVQRNATAQLQGGSTVVSFELDMAAIVQTVVDPGQSDIPCSLSVLVGGEPVADAVPVRLARQPTARLALGQFAGRAFLSPVGERVRIEVDGLLSTDVAGVEVRVTTRDPQAGGAGAMVTRLATDVAFESSGSGVPTLSASIPGNSFPDAVQIVVRDVIAGESTPIPDTFYRPDVVLALPGQGPTTGGSLLTLIGAALVPYDFTGGAGLFDFDRVTLTFSKGGRITELPRDDLRVAESSSDRLVFTMPPSPDGRPGQVDIVLRVELEGEDAIVTASQVFLFANPDPYYGPRGAILDQPPVAAAPIALDNAPNTDAAPDFAILTEQGGVGFLQLLLAQQNGMFQPFAAPRQIGDHEAANERSPRDLLVGDFDGDAIPDLFVVNEGALQAVHHLVLGQQRPGPPLGEVFPVLAAAGSTRGWVAFFDGDNLPDILLIPGPNAAIGQLPSILLSRPVGPGQPAFAPAIDVMVGGFEYQAFEVADFDDDGVLDIAVASGADLKMSVVFGNGDGTFGPAQTLTIVVPGYVPDVASPAVGLHACRNGSRQSLGLVLSGIEGSVFTRPTVAVLPQVMVSASPPTYEFQSPAVAEVYVAPVEPIGLSLAANLDQPAPPADPGPIELVVAIRGEPEIVSIGLLQFDGTAFAPLFGSIENGTAGGTEVPVQIRTLVFDTAFPATQLSGEKKAVFIVHEVDVDGARERRLSTRLITVQQQNEVRLLPPDAGASLPFAIENVVGGNFSAISVAAQDAVRDLALASRAIDSEITVVVNDGFGGFPGFGKSLSSAGLLPLSTTLVPAPPLGFDGLVFASEDSQLGFWRHDPDGPDVQSVTAMTLPLRDLIAVPPLNTTDLDNDTRMQVADVDGDGIQDLVVLMSFAVPAAGEGDSWIALLRGKPAPAANEFPFFYPVQISPVHGNASSFALGDFAFGGGVGTSLEMVVAVPTGTLPASVDGNHLRFYRYQAGAEPRDDRFVFSAVPGSTQVLLAGSEPVLVVASDLDRDGVDDVLVACRGDRSLRLLRNTAAPGGGSVEVDVDAFAEALGSPYELAPGVPNLLRLSDVNGDGNLDAVVFTQYTNLSGVKQAAIATYLSSGLGEFADARFASSTRIGTFDAVLSGDLGDWNRDGVPDLFLGWSVQASPAADVNLRVLFGGTR